MTPKGDDDAITLRVRRSTAFLLLGLLLGLGGGILAGTTIFDSDEQTVYLPSQVGGQPAVGEASADTKPLDIETAGRPARGPEKAKVTLVEFTDYECPFCGRHFRDTLPQIQREYGDRIRYVIRNSPLTNVHKKAAKAAEAAECAFDQGKFWEYHDLLFENQKALEPRDLKRYARRGGLEKGRFDQCLDGGRKRAVVDRDLKDAKKYGVTGTPTFFVNGRKLVGAVPFEQLKAEIDKGLGG